MRKLIAIALLCTPVVLTATVLTSTQAAADIFTDLDRTAPNIFTDLDRTAPRGAVSKPSDVVARGLFDQLNETAPVRRPVPRDDVYPGE